MAVWTDLGVGECVDATGLVFSHGSILAASVDACKALCEKGAPGVCVGVNWLPPETPEKRCMLQSVKGTSQDAIDAAIGAKVNWWWTGGTAPDGPPIKADNHKSGDWTASAICWGTAPSFASGGGLGWSFVVLVALSAASYLVLGVALAQRQGAGQRWPHASFWREVGALVADGVAFLKGRVQGQQRGRRAGGGAQSTATGSAESASQRGHAEPSERSYAHKTCPSQLDFQGCF